MVSELVQSEHEADALKCSASPHSKQHSTLSWSCMSLDCVQLVHGALMCVAQTNRASIKEATGKTKYLVLGSSSGFSLCTAA